MEVSHVRDHVTHAVISSSKTIDFGISDSPEFFHILSSTLYSDQPLAVVREVLCNAWDAHIEAGCANKPVEVTLSENELVIRDFGSGISDDDIGPVYGVYGGSTKKKNKLVTGGFGLGCKAPFAYTDHFEVTSCHAGRRTIYNLSKSSAEVNGRPGIVPIASFPSEETGLQVRIPLKDRNDRYRFQTLIKRIAANGEMSVNLNGDAVDVVPFSSMKHGFMVTAEPLIDTPHKILVRYGHVVYPVEQHDDYHAEFNAVVKFLEKLPEGFGTYRIVFQAKPDSISVTPSREALSMQEHTIKTLSELLGAFNELLVSHLRSDCLEILEEMILNRWINMKPAELFNRSRVVPGIHKIDWISNIGNNVLVERRQLACGKIAAAYPEYQDFRFKDLVCRVNSMVQANFGNTGLIKSYRAELIRLRRRKRFDIGRSSWLHRKVLFPLMRDLAAAGLKADRLAVYGKDFAETQNRGFRWMEDTFTRARMVKPQPIEGFLPFLRNVVVLSHNQEHVHDRVSHFPVMKNWLGESTNLIIYIVPRSSKKQTDAARAFFQARNVELIDLTVYHPWEQAPAPVVRTTEPAKAKIKGLPILSSLVNGGIRTDFLWFDDKDHDIQRTETPKVVIKLPRKENQINAIDGYNINQTNAICALWATQIGVAITSTQYDKYRKAGAIEFDTWVHEQVSAEILRNNRIHQAIASDVSRMQCLQYQGNLHELYEAILDCPELRKEFGLTNELTVTDRQHLELWERLEYEQRYRLVTDPRVKQAFEFAQKIKVDPAAEKLAKLLVERRKYLEALKPSAIRRHLLSKITKDGPKMKPVKDLTTQIVLLALKG